MRQLPNNIRKLRLTTGVSGTTVADMLSMSPQYYYDLETGRRRLNADHIQKLTSIFKCSSDELLGSPSSQLHPRNSNDLSNFLEQPGIMFEGVILTEEDKEKLHKALELAFWDIVRQHKRKKFLIPARNSFAIFFCQMLWCFTANSF